MNTYATPKQGNNHVHRGQDLTPRKSFRLIYAKLDTDGAPFMATPVWLPDRISSKIQDACTACQDWLDIHYGVAECTVCPLVDFVKRLEVR